LVKVLYVPIFVLLGAFSPALAAQDVGDITVPTVVVASWYNQAGQMANGQMFDKGKATVAHPVFPFGTKVRLTRVDDPSLVVDAMVTDRPALWAGKLRPIDASPFVADKLGYIQAGLTEVSMQVLWFPPEKRHQKKRR